MVLILNIVKNKELYGGYFLWCDTISLLAGLQAYYGSSCANKGKNRYRLLDYRIRSFKKDGA